MCCLRDNQTNKRFDIVSSELNKYLIEFEISGKKNEIHESIEFEIFDSIHESIEFEFF